MNKSRMTRMIAGKEVEVPLEEVWDSICKVLRIARILTSPGEREYQVHRMAMLSERLCDLEGITFNYKDARFSGTYGEEFIRGLDK